MKSSGREFDHLRVNPSSVCSFASFELDEGVVEFLHRERLHCVLVLLIMVFVFVFRVLRRRASSYSANTSAISSLSYLLLPPLSCIHDYGDLRTRGGLVLVDFVYFESVEVAQDVFDVVSFFAVDGARMCLVRQVTWYA